MMKKPIHVAVGVILNQQQQVLIALRDSSQHQGNLWEFPGGKVELNEIVENALSRELLEEVNIKVEHCYHLININHDYGDKVVVLDVWCVDEFSGLAKGLEGQEIRWATLSELETLDFPEANIAILESIQDLLVRPQTNHPG